MVFLPLDIYSSTTNLFTKHIVNAPTWIEHILFLKEAHCEVWKAETETKAKL